MKIKLSRTTLLAFFLTASFLNGSAQENSAFMQPGLDYRLAGDLFRNKNFGSARQLYQEISGNVHGEDLDMASTALFREAISAAELENGDAEVSIERFVEENAENALVNDASLYLGKIYFRDKKFKDAVKLFQEVDISVLGKAEKEELYFMMGYSGLKSGDPAKAMIYFQRISSQNAEYYLQAKYLMAHIDYIQGNYESALAAFEELKTDRRYQKVVPLYELQIYHKLGNDEKIMAIGPALVESPGSASKAEVARITGIAFFNTGDYLNAAYYLDIFEKTYRKSLTREDNYLLGFVNYRSGNYKNAISYFQQVIRQEDALSQNAGYYLGVCYNETGQKKYAGNAFLVAYKNGTDTALAEEALFNYIKTGLESPFNPYNESITLLEDYLLKHPGSARADEGYGYLSSLYLTTRNYKQALASMESVSMKDARLLEAYQKILFCRAAELLSVNDLDGALSLYTKASQIKSDESVKAGSLYWMGEIYYRQADYTSAIRYYKEFLNSGKAESLAYYGNAFYNLGYAYFSCGEYSEAIPQFTRFLESSRARDPKLASDAYLRLGDVCFITRQYDKAVTYYDKAISLKEASTDYALYQKALSSGAKGDFTRKTEVLKVLINNYPGSTYYDDGLYEMALAYILLNQENQALTWLDKLEKSGTSSLKATQASLRKGFIYFNRNDYDKAVSSFKTVIERYPGTQEAQEALAGLKNIYIETGEADQYYAYSRGLSFAENNVNEEDSIYYEAAEKQYMQGKCDLAVNSFKKYQDNFPAGAFIANAYYYQAECYLKSGNVKSALEGFKKAAGQPLSPFTEPALARATEMEFDAGNYPAALPLFGQLEMVAADHQNVIASLTGQMRCYYRTGDIASAALAARKLISMGDAPADLTGEIHFILGMDFFAKDDLAQAEYELGITGKLYGTEPGAEASYNLAYISFLEGRLAESEERVYSLAENYAAFDYWVAKGFILLSDIFMKNGDEFQARQTLESVIGNYDGPELGDLARQKLNSIGNE
jgi:TolA-binding protein